MLPLFLEWTAWLADEELQKTVLDYIKFEKRFREGYNRHCCNSERAVGMAVGIGQSETAASTAALPPRAVVAALGSGTHFMLHTIFITAIHMYSSDKLTQKSAVERRQFNYFWGRQWRSKGGTRGSKGRQRGAAVGAAVGAANICGGGTFSFLGRQLGAAMQLRDKGRQCDHV
ncbi:hypothetical protein B0H14DRAFT_2583038 [Mycena olivaceomarginata]|nr:hypothetical protein B0H14DRAFT_2583038 [Mycena olivaceomarginata]